MGGTGYFVKKKGRRIGIVCLFFLFGLTGCKNKAEPQLSFEPDLVVYTALEPEVYGPIVKEFEERTDYLVKVERGSSRELEQMACEGDLPENVKWDLVFGVGTEVLEQTKEWWKPCEIREAECISREFQCDSYRWTAFSAQPLVIMFNTNVVTYRETPTGWSSLLEPRWKGRIGFGDPLQQDIYASALATAVYSWKGQENYLELLFENIDGIFSDSVGEVNKGIQDGRFSLGITTEELAQDLLNQGADVDYIYPQEGTAVFLDGSAILNGCSHEEAAEAFLEFTVGMDVQRMLLSHLNRRPVRTDVEFPKGIPSLDKLPFLEWEMETFQKSKAGFLEQWKTLLNESRKGSGDS